MTEALLAKGWHPRHIAGLIRSKFERDYGWGERWVDYSPAMRADFYVRIFAGQSVSFKNSLREIIGANDSNPNGKWQRTATTSKPTLVTMENIRL